MDFYEVEGKRLMQLYGIPTDEGVLYSQDRDLTEVRYPCVAKAQFLSGKRGKAGGILFAENRAELEKALEKVNQVVINGKHPADILLVPKLDIAQEHYLGIVLDRRAKGVVMLYTPFGGMDIETLAAQSPEKLSRIAVRDTLSWEAWEQATARFSLGQEQEREIYEIACRLLKMFYELDATTLEINPLVRTGQGKLLAADAKFVMDDNARYRHENLTVIPREKETQSNQIAQEAGFAFVELGQGGNIGVVSGGAGIGMATIDAIKLYGGVPYNFLDLGGTTREKTEAAVGLLMHIPEVEGIIVNVFGGVNNCLTMAEGIRDALEKAWAEGLKKPIVVKSRGFNQEEGWQIYDALHLTQVRYGTTDDAVEKLIRLMKKQEAWSSEHSG
ncbi:MAG: ATP-grasp domain-containing protein [Oscillospiraceae bacterium]